MKYFPILAACGLLGGCVTAATPVSHMSYTQVQELSKQIEKRCSDQGITRQSPQFEACIKQESNREVATRQDRYNQIHNDNSVTCNKVGTAMVCN